MEAGGGKGKLGEDCGSAAAPERLFVMGPGEPCSIRISLDRYLRNPKFFRKKSGAAVRNAF